MPFSGVVVWSGFEGDFDLTKGCFPEERLGEEMEGPATLGVNGLLTVRKFELSAGVSGLEVFDLVCLSPDIVVGRGERLEREV